MDFDYRAAELFIAHLRGETDLDAALAHPAYQAVFSHNSLLGSGLDKEDVAKAIRGEKSPYYGIENVRANITQMENLLAVIRSRECGWLNAIKEAQSRLFEPGEYQDILICPIVGYDVGIGHKGHVCLNLNLPYYQKAPEELLYIAIHESFHAVYEKWNALPSLKEIEADPVGAYLMIIQNEGYATWNPLELRRKNQHLGSTDYPVLADYIVIESSESLAEHVRLHDELLPSLSRGDLDLYGFLSMAFGEMRLGYRIGCKMVDLIHAQYGMAAVREGARLDPAEYYRRYSHLLDSIR